MAASSVVKLLTPTGRETKRGADRAARQQRGDLVRRKEKLNQDEINIRGVYRRKKNKQFSKI